MAHEELERAEAKLREAAANTVRSGSFPHRRGCGFVRISDFAWIQRIGKPMDEIVQMVRLDT